MNQLIEDQRQLLVANYHDAVVLSLRMQEQTDEAWDQLQKFNTTHPQRKTND
jgi:hypothetical protein